MNSAEMLNQTLKIINSTWSESKYFDSDELNDYRTIWKNFRSKLNSLSGSYGKRTSKGKKKEKPIYQVPIANMSWKSFMNKVNDDRYHSPGRL